MLNFILNYNTDLAFAPGLFSQAGLPGFYDPCVGEEKSLKVLYQFRGVLHQVLSGDTEALRIPKQCGCGLGDGS